MLGADRQSNWQISERAEQLTKDKNEAFHGQGDPEQISSIRHKTSVNTAGYYFHAHERDFAAQEMSSLDNNVGKGINETIFGDNLVRRKRLVP
jgi:hypothetical protein